MINFMSGTFQNEMYDIYNFCVTQFYKKLRQR